MKAHKKLCVCLFLFMFFGEKGLEAERKVKEKGGKLEIQLREKTI